MNEKLYLIVSILTISFFIHLIPAEAATIRDNYQNKSSDLSICELKETENINEYGSRKGFPIKGALPTTGEINILIIPIDFINAPGVGDPNKMFPDDIKKINEWSTYFSRGKLTYKATLASNTWIRAPRGAEWYTIAGQKGGKTQMQSPSAGIQELINEVDKVYEFKKVDFIWFVFPYSAEKNYGTFIYTGVTERLKINTSEGEFFISAYGEQGGSVVSFDRNDIWDILIHELLHFQGFIGHGPDNGSGLGIMQNQSGNSKAVLSWEAFMAGWFGKDQVICLEKSKIKNSLIISMGSIDKFDKNPVSVIVKLSDEEVIIVEKRSSGKFTDFNKDYKFTNFPQRKKFANKNTYTAYYVNVNNAVYRDDSDPNSYLKNFWYYLREKNNVALAKSVSSNGVKIEILNTNQIKISLS
jgi:hypothetical protein